MKTFVCFQQSFSRHGIARASAALLIWLNENVHFHAPFLASAIRVNSIALGLTKWFVCFQLSFSRLGIARASAALLIWLNENVPLYASLNSAADGNLRGNSRNSGVLCFLRAAWFGSSLSKWRDCFFSGFYSRFIEKGAPLPIKHEKYRFLIQKDSEMRK